MYRHTIENGAFSGVLRKLGTANSFTRASCHSWSREGQTSTTVFQKIRSVPHFLQPPAIDREPDSNAKMYANQMAGRDGANLKAHISSLAFPRKIPVRDRFSNAVFNHFRLRIFSRTNENRLVIAQRAHFRQKLKIDKKAWPELLLQSFLDATYPHQHVILDSTYKKRRSGLKDCSNPVFSFLNNT